MYNLYIPFCSLIISLFLIILFKIKFKKNLINENKYYFKMILDAFFATCFCILSIYMIYIGKSELQIVKISNKLECFVLFNFSINLFIYIYTNCHYKKILWSKELLINTIVFFSIMIIPSSLKINQEMSYMVVVGPLIYLTNFLIISFLFFTICLVIKNYKILKEKIISVVFIIIFLILIAIIREIAPQFICMEFLLSLSTLIMYHTIENPDIKLLEEIHKSKEISDNANEEKTLFLYNITEEIRKTIDTVNDYAKLILESDNPDEIKDSARTIIGENAKFINTTNEILDVSKIESSNIKIYNNKYNFKNLLKEIVTIYTKTCENKNIEFRTNIDHDIPDILHGDSINLKKAITTILNNSIEYTSKGYIDLTINSIIKNDICRLIITIEDSGIGLTSEELNSFKTDKTSLSEADNIITLLQGAVIVSSNYGKGTKVKIILDQLIEVKENETVKKYDETLNNIKIMMVDNSESSIKIVEKLLKNTEIELDKVTNGAICLEKIRNKNKYNLILLDEELNDVSGKFILDKLKAIRNFNIPIILLTKDNSYEYNDKAHELGFNDYLIKPMNKEKLLKMIVKYK